MCKVSNDKDYLTDNPNRRCPVIDKAKTERRIQTLARDFKYSGHRWGKIKNFAEVPVFLDSKASRLIQLSDLVAFSLYRHFAHADPRFYRIIEGCFDAEGGIKHGLYTNFKQ